MRFSQVISLALAAVGSSASPIEKRAIDDFGILNYALTLEYLERKFYNEGLANYSHAAFISAGFPDPFYQNLVEIAKDERTHVDFLNTAITAAGGKPVHEAKYAFPSMDAKSFVTVSSILEGVGVSAYLGAASKIANKDYVTAAGSILTVEARHSSYIRAALKESPFPTSFDTPLDFNEVFSLAAMFITSFAPGDPPLPFKAFPPLMVAPASSYKAGSSYVTFTGAAKKYPHATYVAYFNGLKPMFAPLKKSGADYSAAIPAGIAGQTYAVLTNCATKATDDTILAGPVVLEVTA